MNSTRTKYPSPLLLAVWLAAALAAGQTAAAGPPPNLIRNVTMSPPSSCCTTGAPSQFMVQLDQAYQPGSTLDSVTVEAGKLRIKLLQPSTWEVVPFHRFWVAVDVPPQPSGPLMPVEVSMLDAVDDPAPRVLFTSTWQIAFADGLKVLSVLPAHPGPEDEITIIANRKPPYASVVVDAETRHVRVGSLAQAPWSEKPEGWPIPIGRLPAGEWRIELIDGLAAEKRIAVKEPPAEPATLAVLANGFEVAASFTTAAGEDGPARLVQPPSRDSALFYFFSPANWELMVKVLDGCAINHHYWVFGAASTDVGYRIDIRRQGSSQTYSYENPIGRTAPAITDIEAFPCDPQAD